MRLRQLCAHACACVDRVYVRLLVCVCVCACMRVCLCVRAYHHNIQLRHSTNIVYNCLRSNTIENAVEVPLKTDSDEEMCAA